MIRLFDFECIECGTKFERLFENGDTVHCPMCNSVRVDRLPPYINVAMGVGAYGYYDENLEQYISTNKQRREVMRQQGVTEKGGTPKPTGDAWF